MKRDGAGQGSQISPCESNVAVPFCSEGNSSCLGSSDNELCSNVKEMEKPADSSSKEMHHVPLPLPSRRSERLKSKYRAGLWRTTRCEKSTNGYPVAQTTKGLSSEQSSSCPKGYVKSLSSKQEKIRKRKVQKRNAVDCNDVGQMYDSKFWFEVCAAVFLSSDEEDSDDSDVDSIIIAQAVREVVHENLKSERSQSSPTCRKRQPVSKKILDLWRQYSYTDLVNNVFECTACKQKCSCQADLLRHLNSHVCSLCRVFFIDKTRSTDHRCSRSSNHNLSLYAVSHYNRRLFSKNIVRQVKEKKFLCKPCYVQFPTSNMLMRHMISHVCRHCELFHSNKDKLREHIEEQHIQTISLSQLDFKRKSYIVNNRLKREHCRNSKSKLNTAYPFQIEKCSVIEPKEETTDSVTINNCRVSPVRTNDFDSEASPESNQSSEVQQNCLKHSRQLNGSVSREDKCDDPQMVDAFLESRETETGPLHMIQSPSKSEMSAEDKLISSICQDMPLDLCPFENKYYVTVATRPVLNSQETLAEGLVTDERKQGFGTFVVSATSVPKSRRAVSSKR